MQNNVNNFKINGTIHDFNAASTHIDDEQSVTTITPPRQADKLDSRKQVNLTRIILICACAFGGVMLFSEINNQPVTQLSSVPLVVQQSNILPKSSGNTQAQVNIAATESIEPSRPALPTRDETKLALSATITDLGATIAVLERERIAVRLSYLDSAWQAEHKERPIDKLDW